MSETPVEIIWTEYIRYRVELRGYDLAKIEHIVRYSTERYIDTATGRRIIVGRHDTKLVMMPCDFDENSVCPVTIHATTRQQIRFRIKTGRFVYE